MSATKTKVLICPYCGDTQAATERCRACGGLFEPLSRQASHNAMGPWYVRDEKRPFQPGASYETIVKLIERGIITKYTILRSPTTKQFWTVARRVPGIAHLLGYCHNCDANVGKDDHGCPSCGVPFGAYLDRNYLGLPEVKPLPWEAPVIEEGRGGGVTAAMRGFAPSGSESAMDFRRAAEPLGLSSFASDDELRDMAARPAYVPPAATPGAENGAAHEHHQSAGVETAAPYSATALPASAGEQRALTLDSASGVAARSMQRRLQRQQSQIRLLMIGLGVVSVLSVVVIIAMLLRDANNGGDTKQPPQSGQPNPVAADANGTKNANDKAAPKGADAGNPSDAANQVLDDSPPSSTMPADDLNAPPVESQPSVAAEYERAVALLAEGKKEERSLKDRIHDVESVVASLKAISHKTSVGDRPADLAKTLAEAERLLERLKLQEFFP